MPSGALTGPFMFGATLLRCSSAGLTRTNVISDPKLVICATISMPPRDKKARAMASVIYRD